METRQKIQSELTAVTARSELSGSDCYQALQARDRRFDGHFFVAVSSTGIYCRPVCTVRVPMLKNCSFYGSAAGAEAKGFRPCLRCRPEMAPGQSSVDATHVLARQSADLIDAGYLENHSLAAMARRLNVSDRHLRRAFLAEFGVSPIQWAQTKRLLLAKQLLTDTRLSVTQIAYASGFKSLRRFNALFVERYRLAPGALRVKRSSVESEPQVSKQNELTCYLAYRPPYDWASLMEFFRLRSIPGVDCVTSSELGEVYRRCIQCDSDRGWLEVANVESRHVLRITVSLSLAKHMIRVLDLVRRVFDLSCDPQRVARALQSGSNPMVNLREGLRLPGSFDLFECSVRAVLGQQITVKAATTLAGRLLTMLAQECNLSCESPWPELNRVFPEPELMRNLTVVRLAEIGIIRQRGTAILALAELMTQSGLLKSQQGLPPAARQLRESLSAVVGIGPWTVDYVSMRSLQWPDVFLSTDVVVLNALNLGKPLSVVQAARQANIISKQWSPWRSYAVLQLWAGAKVATSINPCAIKSERDGKDGKGEQAEK